MLDFSAAIFDLDGTLLDSMGVWEKIDIDFLAKRGLPVPDTYINEICARSFQEAAEYTISLFNLDERIEDLVSEWNSMAIYEYSHNIGLKPYAKEYLALLKSCGIKLGTATSLPKVLSEPVLRNNGIYNYFDIQCSTDEANRGKEFPDVFVLASQKLEVPAEQCIVFEDLLPGIISAKNAGMKAFCVYDEYSKEQRAEILKIADGYLYDFKKAPVPVKK